MFVLRYIHSHNIDTTSSSFPENKKYVEKVVQLIQLYIHFSHDNTISIYFNLFYKISILISDCQISYKS
ncbi:Uncharacterised protein [Shigella sonnei]|nr:Uncharacterised protein [Shigella sonnei]SJG98179.1 Uncharacterised protein [Shigella sonnei]